MNEATPLSKSFEGAGARAGGRIDDTSDSASVSASTSASGTGNNSRFRTTAVTFVGGMVVMMMMMMALSNNNNNTNTNTSNLKKNNNYLYDSEGEVIRTGGRMSYYEEGGDDDDYPGSRTFGSQRDSLKRSKSKGGKSDKKGSKSGKSDPTRTASIRIIETIDPTDPDGSGDIILSLGFNPLTQALSLVGSNFVTNGSVFRTKDIHVKDGVLIGTIPFENQIGDTSSTCTITKGTFKPEEGIIFIKSATCNYSTCFPPTAQVDKDDDDEECFFGISGGTLDIDGASLIFGKTIKGVLSGGTGPFGGLAGSFTVRKIVQGVFPPPTQEIQYNVFQVDFIFDDSVDTDGCPLGICDQ